MATTDLQHLTPEDEDALAWCDSLPADLLPMAPHAHPERRRLYAFVGEIATGRMVPVDERTPYPFPRGQASHL